MTDPNSGRKNPVTKDEPTPPEFDYPFGVMPGYPPVMQDPPIPTPVFRVMSNLKQWEATPSKFPDPFRGYHYPPNMPCYNSSEDHNWRKKPYTERNTPDNYSRYSSKQSMGSDNGHTNRFRPPSYYTKRQGASVVKKSNQNVVQYDEEYFNPNARLNFNASRPKKQYSRGSRKEHGNDKKSQQLNSCKLEVKNTPKEVIDDSKKKEVSDNESINDDNISVNDESQRENLIRLIANNKYECIICFSVIRSHVAIWNCDNCYHIFHLYCIKKWCNSITTNTNDPPPLAASSGSIALPTRVSAPVTTVESGGAALSNIKLWRCPSCQKEHTAGDQGFVYSCFCGKLVNPPEIKAHQGIPHSCSEVCTKSRMGHCPHPCNILCHPGPCPPCEATVTRSCHCGRSTLTLPCRQAANVQCQATCQRVLNCGLHLCQTTCHADACSPCDSTSTQACYCGEQSRIVICGSKESFLSGYGCGAKCSRKLTCGLHQCTKVCHPGPCDTCDRLAQNHTRCPCGKSGLRDLVDSKNVHGDRTSCTDPIPTCGDTCDRVLPGCGHKCPSACHDSPCPPCPFETNATCRCGSTKKMMPCREMEQATLTEAYGTASFKCKKRCKKMKSCGSHRCSETCCMLTEHKCDLICDKLLSCGLHRCDEVCHAGSCATCWRVNFSEETCECGAARRLPPIACGEPPPSCTNICSRQHSCDHPIQHTCHSEPNCPPCTVLGSKMCPGGHTLMHNIPCFQPVVTCGLTCNATLPCSHSCVRLCHEGPCATSCSQPCTTPRASCGHPCALPCHAGQPCPGAEEDNDFGEGASAPTENRAPKPQGLCRKIVNLKCPCGQRNQNVFCHTLDGPSKYEMITAMSAGTNGESVAIASVAPGRRNKALSCDSVCSQLLRNQKMAEALNISNPAVQPTLAAPLYIKFLKDYGLENFSFVLSVEKAYEDVIKSVKESKHKSRCHNFQPMNRDKRRFIHELGDFYGMETQSYDQEPLRSVTATAYKDKCFLPSVKLSAVLIREYPQILKGQTVLSKPTLLPASSEWGRNNLSPGTSGGAPTMKVLGRGNSSLAPVSNTFASRTSDIQPVTMWSKVSRENSVEDNTMVSESQQFHSVLNPNAAPFDYFDMVPLNKP